MPEVSIWYTVDAVLHPIVALKNRNDGIKNRSSDIKKRIDAVKKRIDAVKKRIDDIENRIDAIQECIGSIDFRDLRILDVTTRPFFSNDTELQPVNIEN